MMVMKWGRQVIPPGNPVGRPFGFRQCVDEHFMAFNGSTHRIHALWSRLEGWSWFWLYVVLAMLIQWPLTGSITSQISYGHETESTVPLLNLWTVWWNAHSAGQGFRDYWNAPIFYPTTKTFVFSEAQPTSLVVAPLLWLTGNRCLAYNTYQLLILALNGYSAHRLLRRLGHIPWLAFCGGVMSQILPFVMWQFGVVQLTTLFGIYWTIQAVIDLFEGPQTIYADPVSGLDIKTPGLPAARTPSFTAASSMETEVAGELPNPTATPWHTSAGPSRRLIGLRLVLVYGITYWACNYWGLFLTLLLVPCSLCFWNRRLLLLAFWREIGLAGLMGLVMIGPFALLQRSLAASHDWQSSRTEDLVYGLSAHPQDHTDVPWRTWTSWLERPELDRDNVWGLGGGGLKLLMVPLGLIVACATPRRRRWGLFALVFGLAAFGLSLGPTVRVAEGIPLMGQASPYQLLQQYVPGFGLIRSPFRFAVFVQLAAVWLSVEALDLLNPARWTKEPHSVSVSAWIPLVLMSSLVTLEAVPPTTRLCPLPAHDRLPVWVVWLRDHAEPGGGIACLPFPRGNQVGDYEETTHWMYWGTFHGRPLLNGYSGFFPKPYNDLRDALDQYQIPANLKEGETFVPGLRNYAWDSPGLKMLNESSARYVVIKRSFGAQEDIGTHPQTRFRWALVVSDEFEKIDVYELPSHDD